MGKGSGGGKAYRRYVSPGFTNKATSETYRAGDDFDECGAFESVRFGPTDDGFVIGTFKVEGGESIICKGTVPAFVIGAPFQVKGKVVCDKTWGIQVNITHAIGSRPTTVGQIEAFLGSGAIRGVGPSTAKKIVKHFGADTLKILETEPSRLEEVSGIGPKTIEKIAYDVSENLRDRESIGYFASLGIGIKTIRTLLQEYGSAAKEHVEQNPYILCRVRGFAFTRADSIAMKMGISKTDPNRLYAGVLQTLRYMCDSEGHTLVPEDALFEKAQEKLEVQDLTKLSHALSELVRTKRVIKDKDGYHLKYLFRAEKVIKKRLARSLEEDILLREPVVAQYLSEFERARGITLTDEQTGAVHKVFKKKLSILSGAAGAGKAAPLYTKVLCEHGWKKMGDIKVGDVVWTPKGTLAPVTGVFPQGAKEIYRLTLSDGRTAECCNEHIWRTVDEAGENAHDMTLQEMIDAGEDVKFRLPTNAAIPFSKVEFQVEPFEKGKSLVEAEDGFVPDVYKSSSISQRIALLQGMLAGQSDTAEKGTASFGGLIIAEDFVEILRSLGASATIRFEAEDQRFEVLSPAICDLAAGNFSAQTSSAGAVAVTAIERTGRKTEMQCIMVDDDDHLYITDGYVVTHNTAVSSAIVSVCRAAGIPICLMAPTGRAAKHLSDTCGGSEPGYTMHRALSLQIRQAKDDDFFDDRETVRNVSESAKKAKSKFDEARVVIADEASMMDTEMAAILIQACKDKHLMLVGDPNQLPSVGPGRVLGDLMESSYSKDHGILTFLTRVFRQKAGSPVINAANAVGAGDSPTSIPGVRFYSVSSNEEVPKVIDEHVLPYLRERHLGYENYAFLSPIKKTPFAGVNALNEFLRPKLNPHYVKPDDPKKEFLMQRGDFVMQTKNNYECDIFNGDIGIVQDVFRDGDVEVLFSGDTDEVCYDKAEVYEEHQIIPAFAMTVHKSQGDQYDTVIVVLTSSQFPMLNRNLLYTAVTRAENELILIGDAKAFAMAAGNQKENKRMTGLRGL